MKTLTIAPPADCRLHPEASMKLMNKVPDLVAVQTDDRLHITVPEDRLPNIRSRFAELGMQILED